MSAREDDKNLRKRQIKAYTSYWGSKEHDTKRSANLTNSYYDSVTWLYEHGWGQSFHFYKYYRGIGRKECMLHHELWLFSKLRLSTEDICVDIGCGVGGPMRQAYRYSNCTIYGLNNNQYQIDRCAKINKEQGLGDRFKFIKCDFTNIALPDSSVTKAYAIEATCHASNLKDPYKEIYRILKPGGLFACYEWVITDKYKPSNAEENKYLEDIKVGNSLVKLHTQKECIDALISAGFEIVESCDRAYGRELDLVSEYPWYNSLSRVTETNIFHKIQAVLTPVLNAIKLLAVMFMELLGVCDKGSTEAMKVLMVAGDGLLNAGKAEIYTPMFYFLAKKSYSKDTFI